MGRAAVPPLWHSRAKLGVSSVVLIVLTICIDWRGSRIEEEEKQPPPVQTVPDDLMTDINTAQEYLQYMADLKAGKAEIKAVFEAESEVEELYWSCSLKPSDEMRKGWIENDGIHLYSAHYDDRENSLFPRNHAIQVLAMSYRSIPESSTVYCNIYSGRKSAMVRAVVREIWQRAWDPRDQFYIPNLITCPLPNRLRNLPSSYSISLSNSSCTAQPVALKVDIPNRKTAKAAVAVCVKGMDFQEDISSRLVEWIEAQLLFGVDKICMYTYTVSNGTKRVMEHYEKTGKLETISLELPGLSPNIPSVRSSYIWRNRQQKRRHELIPYNDCLYRHLHSHRYILIIDTDELVVPLKHSDYSSLLDEIEQNQPGRKISSISIRNVFKFPTKKKDEKGEDLYFLRNRSRSRKTSNKGEYGKSFTSTSHAVSVFNHFALHRTSREISPTTHLPEEVAVKLHYKAKCPVESTKECKELEEDRIEDGSLDGVAERLREGVRETLRIIG